MSSVHEDDRGRIEDLKVGKDWSITYISFKKGAVRGNHYHKKTTQTDYILSGSLMYSRDGKEEMVVEGDTLFIQATVKHAYKALTDAEIISVCKGVRIGENYEEDTFRLETPLL